MSSPSTAPGRTTKIDRADTAFAALASFEESVARDEASAKAFESLSGDADADLEAEFSKLDTSSVDSDLEALKKELGK